MIEINTGKLSCLEASKASRCLSVAMLALGILMSFPALSTEFANEHIESLFEELASAQTLQEGKLAEDEIWRYWFNAAPTKEVREAMDAGMERREAYDYEAAEKHFDDAVRLAPEFAEAYNQRAFIRFLRENYGQSLSDLEKALELEPNHFAAHAGVYHVLLRQDRSEAAIKSLQIAVGLHPWINERHGLPKELWPLSYRNIHEKGDDI